MFGPHRNSWIKIVFACFLLAGLPIFIWAVLTQRIELRKHAATSEPTQICWNRVISENGTYNWPDSCKGSPQTDLTCTQILIPLTTEETAGYQTWVSMGQPYIPGCGIPTPTPITWQTPYASLQADEMTITANGKTFKADPATNLQLHSNPPNTPDYMTLEATWKENNVEMRMFIYFNADTVTTETPYRRWWVNEIRTYNGNNPGDWIYYHRPQLSNMAMMGMGYPFIANDLTITSNEGGIGTVHFKSLRLQAFLNENPTPTPTPGQPTIIPNSSPTPTPTPNINVTPTWTPTPHPQTLELWVRLAGVSGGQANGAKLNKVKFYLSNGSVMEIPTPLTLTYLPNTFAPDGNGGIYKTSVVITNPLPGGTQFKISIKGEKHTAVKFCQAQGQTGPCKDADYITMPNTSGTYILYLTGIPLPPGDLNQDGVINNTDLTLLTDIFKKPSSQITAADLKLADVNYDGYVDNFDLSLILQSLSIRYDE